MIPLPLSKMRRLIHLPPHSQTSAIKASLARKEGETTRLEIEITKLKDRLEFLANEQETLKDALSSIKKLPPEVLQEIFISCLPVAHNAVMSAREAPLLLCRVCHGWRELAHATPRLWASIHIPLTNNMVLDPVPSPDDVISWLSRSKSLPLSISLDCYSPGIYSGLPQIKPYLDSIISVKGRWKSFHISHPLPTVLEYIFSDDSDAVFGSLEELLVDSTSLPILGGEKPLPPNLHSLSLPFRDIMGVRLKADFRRLIRLGITGPTYDSTVESYDLSEIIPVLQSVPLLESLSISGFHTSYSLGSSPFSHQIIHLPNLESLSITNYQPLASVWELLRALHTPVLRHWKYYLLVDPRFVDEHLDVLSIFLRRLEEPLEELNLYLFSSGAEFPRILSMLPGLKRLSVQKPLCSGPWFPRRINEIGDFHLRCLIEDSLFQSKSESNHTTPRSADDSEDIEPVVTDPTLGVCCPQLEVIKCVFRMGTLSEHALLDFLRVRTGVGAKAAGITPLKKLVVLIESPISEGLKERVNQLLDGTGTLFHLLSAPPFGRAHRF